MPEKTDKELLQETHDSVIRIEEQITTIVKSQTDHEKRLRVLERWGAMALGALALFELFTKLN